MDLAGGTFAAAHSGKRGVTVRIDAVEFLKSVSVVVKGGKSLGSCAHWHSVVEIYWIAPHRVRDLYLRERPTLDVRLNNGLTTVILHPCSRLHSAARFCHARTERFQSSSC